MAKRGVRFIEQLIQRQLYTRKIMRENVKELALSNSKTQLLTREWRLNLNAAIELANSVILPTTFLSKYPELAQACEELQKVVDPLQMLVARNLPLSGDTITTIQVAGELRDMIQRLEHFGIAMRNDTIPKISENSEVCEQLSRHLTEVDETLRDMDELLVELY